MVPRCLSPTPSPFFHFYIFSPFSTLFCGEYTGAQLAMWDRWVSGCVEMGLLWKREMGGQGHRFLITATGQRGQSWLCFLLFSFHCSLSQNENYVFENAVESVCVCVCVCVCVHLYFKMIQKLTNQTCHMLQMITLAKVSHPCYFFFKKQKYWVILKNTFACRIKKVSLLLNCTFEV